MSEHLSHQPEQGILYADLSPEVRLYADNLRVQISDLLMKYGITATDLKEAEDALVVQARKNPKQFLPDLHRFNDLLTALNTIRETGDLPMEAKETQPITATVSVNAISTIPAERGKEVTLNLQEVFTSSLAFHEAKSPPFWAESLREAFPHGLTLTPDQRQTIEHAMECGFTRVLLMPGADVQGITTVDAPDPADSTKTIRVLVNPDTLRQTTDHLLQSCATDPVPGLPDDEQYTTPHTYEPEETNFSTLRTGAPSRQRPYLVFVSPGSIPDNLKNLTFPEVDAALAQLARDLNLPTFTGLTIIDRLLHQRREVEQRAPLTPDQRITQYGDAHPHAFDAYSDITSESNWTWDLDSRVSGGCCHGGWGPASRQSELGWLDASSRLKYLGVRPAVVVPL